MKVTSLVNIVRRGAYAFGVMMVTLDAEAFRWQTRDAHISTSYIKAHFTKYNDKHVFAVDDINDTGTTLQFY